MTRIRIETDSSILVTALRTCSFDQSVGELFREAIEFIRLNFVKVEVVFAPRSCNKCAHELLVSVYLGTRTSLLFGLIPSRSLCARL
uniref:RNase H type-1 domain-containing protein n=1 Tax=Arundo donax TaxID=35708 RepID=A0A0A8ZJT0_ARUDO